MTTKLTSKFVGSSARSLSALPDSAWREAVADKTAAFDARLSGSAERVASVQKAMEVNKEVIEKAVGGIKSEVEKAVGGIKSDVGEIKSDMKYALRTEMAAMEKVLLAEVSSMKRSFKTMEKLIFLAIATFLFAKPALAGFQEVVEASKAGSSVKKDSS